MYSALHGGVPELESTKPDEVLTCRCPGAGVHQVGLGYDMNVSQSWSPPSRSGSYMEVSRSRSPLSRSGTYMDVSRSWSPPSISRV